MSYTDNGDGTVTDNVTGLMWQKQDDNLTREWADAGSYCDNLALAGYTDWRLPNEYELQGIVNYGRYSPAIDLTYFLGTKSDFYWSSSTNAYGTDYAWVANFGDGWTGPEFKTIADYARCLRGEAAVRSFTGNGNGTVSDNVTGLMWQEEDDNSTRVWEDALGYCEALTLAGYTDWRLPNIKEMQSIVDIMRGHPAIDLTYFPGTKSDLYWSSSTNAYYPDVGYAWDVDFEDGHVSSDNKTRRTSYIRCVR